jgi:hypothetical protein
MSRKSKMLGALAVVEEEMRRGDEEGNLASERRARAGVKREKEGK